MVNCTSLWEKANPCAARYIALSLFLLSSKVLEVEGWVGGRRYCEIYWMD